MGILVDLIELPEKFLNGGIGLVDQHMPLLPVFLKISLRCLTSSCRILNGAE
jgi:hypothetical protein